MDKKQAKKKLKQLGIVPDTYPTIQVEGSFKTIVAVAPKQSNITTFTQGLSRTEFRRVPIYHSFNPYKALVKAMMDGTYTDDLRIKIEAQVRKAKA